MLEFSSIPKDDSYSQIFQQVVVLKLLEICGYQEHP